MNEKRRAKPVERAAARLGAVQALYQMDLAGTDVGEKAIDPAVDKILDPAWPLHRLDSTVRAILRAGAYELMFMDRVPARVAISEYVDVADAFFEKEEPRFVNGVLDRLARQRRPGEFAA